MADYTVYCEECLENVPSNEVFWDENRLYCKRCGSEVESPDPDLFDQILENRTDLVFRDEGDDLLDDEEEEERQSEVPKGVKIIDEEEA